MKRSERSDAEIQLSKQVVQTFPSKQKVCLREHLRTNYGLDDAGSSHCANACVNLREALVLSADEEELIRFEKHRIRRAERWVASAEPP